MYGCDCYAYGLLAMGFADLVVEADLKPYDYMALVPIVKGAGGYMTDWRGNALRFTADRAALESGDFQGEVIACGDAKVLRACRRDAVQDAVLKRHIQAYAQTVRPALKPRHRPADRGRSTPPSRKVRGRRHTTRDDGGEEREGARRATRATARTRRSTSIARAPRARSTSRGARATRSTRRRKPLAGATRTASDARANDARGRDDARAVNEKSIDDRNARLTMDATRRNVGCGRKGAGGTGVRDEQGKHRQARGVHPLSLDVLLGDLRGVDFHHDRYATRAVPSLAAEILGYVPLRRERRLEDGADDFAGALAVGEGGDDWVQRGRQHVRADGYEHYEQPDRVSRVVRALTLCMNA